LDVSATDPRVPRAAVVEPGGAATPELRRTIAAEPRGAALAPASSAAAVELHIDELVLHGVPPSERQRIGEALRVELARLFAERGVPPRLAQGFRLPAIDAGAFDVGAETGAEMIGRRVARHVYAGLGA
jgi:hypothetical protein